MQHYFHTIREHNLKLAKATILALAFFAVFGVQTAASQQIVLQIGSSAPINSPWDLGLKKLAAVRKI